MSEGISYHNKDVLFKFLSELYKDATFDIFGIEKLPKIKHLLPSNMPKVQADERRTDTQFLLEDGSILMLEYESNDRIAENHIKYMDYAQRVLDRTYREEKVVRPIHLVVIYTSDVAKVDDRLNAGAIAIQSNAILLSEHNGDVILEHIHDKIERGEMLTQEELMKLSILPLMHSTKAREEITRDTINVAKKIQDDREQIQVIAGILTATDKFIDDAFATKMKEWLSMTKVGRLFEKEIEEERERAREEAREEAIEENTKKMAKAMLRKKIRPQEVAEETGLDIEEVKKLNDDD